MSPNQGMAIMRVKINRTATLLAVLLVSVSVLSAQIGPIYQVVVAIDPVAIDVAITDPQGRSVNDLTRDDFLVYEDGEPQELQSAEVIGMPYSILLLVDRSPRDQKSDWPRFVVRSVDLFLKNLRGPDRLAVAAFDDRVAVLVDWRPSRNGIVQRVMLRKSDQHTRFFEAVNWASEEMDLTSVGGTKAQPLSNGRRGVIVFTDGRDIDMYPKYVTVNGQHLPDPLYEVPESVDLRFEKSRQMLQGRPVPFYFVAVDTDKQLSEKSPLAKLDGWVRFLKEVRSRIEGLAESSGGVAAFPRRIEDLRPLYERIQRDLGTGYQLKYTSRRPANGKVRQVEVRVRDANLQVYQSSTNYYAH
jgi:VWFA-related protein